MIYRATVVNRADPSGRTAIKVTCPSVYGASISPWVESVEHSIAPEIGQTVWVSFEAGDISKPVWFGSAAAAQASEFGVQLMAAADATAARLLLEAQQLNAVLTMLAGLVPAGNRLPYFPNATSMALTGITGFSRNFLDDPDAAAGRTTLELGSMAVINSPAPIANGGSGQTTQAAAITALTGTQTVGQYLRSNGTNAALAAIVAGDVPTLNQNTTGTADNVTQVFQAFTPQVDQGASTNIAKNVSYCRYIQIGELVVYQGRLAITGSGTAGSEITVTLPVTPQNTSSTAFCVGEGFGTVGASNRVKGICVLTNSLLSWRRTDDNTATTGWGASPNAALQNADALIWSAMYEAG